MVKLKNRTINNQTFKELTSAKGGLQPIQDQIMSIKALSDYTFYSRYARYNKQEKRRESWDEAVDRVYQMHRTKYAKQIEEHPELGELIDFAQMMQTKKRVLAAQRSLQFAGEPIFKHELKMFNCLTTHIDRERVFQEIMYSLLCGCGVGFSVQKQHISKLGELFSWTERVDNNKEKSKITYVVEDSIEGWADAVGVLMSSWFKNSWGEFDEYKGRSIDFDFSQIRPEGALIAGQFKAPGPDGLRITLEKIHSLLATSAWNNEAKGNNNTLSTIDAYDIIMHISDAVLSGGVRRSATLCLFSHDDEDMMTAKTGDWFIKNPQRGRSNNSAALLKGHVTAEEFHALMKAAEQFGEPGFIWVDNLDSCFNPCVAGDSSIKLPNGGWITMKDLVEKVQNGEEVEVISYNVETGEEEIDLVKYGIKTRESANVIKLELEDGRVLKLTPSHRVLTSNRGYVEASRLTEDDDIITDSNFDNSQYQEFSEATPVEYIDQEKWTNMVVVENK